MISFDPLWRTLKAKYMNKGDLQKLTGLSSATIAKLSKNESITLDVVDRIAVALKVQIYDVVEIIENIDNIDNIENQDSAGNGSDDGTRSHSKPLHDGSGTVSEDEGYSGVGYQKRYLFMTEPSRSSKQKYIGFNQKTSN